MSMNFLRVKVLHKPDPERGVLVRSFWIVNQYGIAIESPYYAVKLEELRDYVSEAEHSRFKPPIEVVIQTFKENKMRSIIVESMQVARSSGLPLYLVVHPRVVKSLPPNVLLERLCGFIENAGADRLVFTLLPINALARASYAVRKFCPMLNCVPMFTAPELKYLEKEIDSFVKIASMDKYVTTDVVGISLVASDVLTRNKLKVVEALYNRGVLEATKPLITFGGLRTKPTTLSYIALALDIIRYGLSVDGAGPPRSPNPFSRGGSDGKDNKKSSEDPALLIVSQGLYYGVRPIKDMYKRNKLDKRMLAVIGSGLASADIGGISELHALALKDIERMNIIAKLRYTEQLRIQPSGISVYEIFREVWRLLGLERELNELNAAVKRISQAMAGEGALDSGIGR